MAALPHQVTVALNVYIQALFTGTTLRIARGIRAAGELVNAYRGTKYDERLIAHDRLPAYRKY